jgi:hypothetical protein
MCRIVPQATRYPRFRRLRPDSQNTGATASAAAIASAAAVPLDDAPARATAIFDRCAPSIA